MKIYAISLYLRIGKGKHLTYIIRETSHNKDEISKKYGISRYIL